MVQLKIIFVDLSKLGIFVSILKDFVLSIKNMENYKVFITLNVLILVQQYLLFKRKLFYCKLITTTMVSNNEPFKRKCTINLINKYVIIDLSLADICTIDKMIFYIIVPICQNQQLNFIIHRYLAYQEAPKSVKQNVQATNKRIKETFKKQKSEIKESYEKEEEEKRIYDILIGQLK